MMVAFFVLAFVLIVSALAVVLFHNPLYSALSLVFNLFVVAGLFAMLDAHFLATVQIIVYAGAIMVLVLFVIMLLNVKDEKPKKFGNLYIAVTLIASALFGCIVLPILQDGFKDFPVTVEPVIGTTEAIGEVLYTRYVYPFEATSLLIMAAIVGAVMVARRKRSDQALSPRGEP